MAGAVLLRFVKSTAGFHVYENGDRGVSVGKLYIARKKMTGPEDQVLVTWPEPPESGR